MHEKQVLPVVVVGLAAALVAVIALWTLDRVAGPDQATASQDGPVEVIEWKLVTTWPKGLPGLGAAPRILRAGSMKPPVDDCESKVWCWRDRARF